MAPVKTLHLHIGNPRCGSTLVQAFFNEDNVREVFGRRRHGGHGYAGED